MSRLFHKDAELMSRVFQSGHKRTRRRVFPT